MPTQPQSASSRSSAVSDAALSDRRLSGGLASCSRTGCTPLTPSSESSSITHTTPPSSESWLLPATALAWFQLLAEAPSVSAAELVEAAGSIAADAAAAPVNLAYDPSGGSESIKNFGGIAYVLLVAAFLYKVLGRRAQRARVEVSALEWNQPVGGMVVQAQPSTCPVDSITFPIQSRFDARTVVSLFALKYPSLH